MKTDKDLVHKQTIANAFSAAANTYEQAAYVEREIGSRLLARLAYIRIKPLRILDLGCGTGYFTRQLQELFPEACVVGIDLALGMVKAASSEINNSSGIQYLCADAQNLPFADRSFDLVFSNCCLMYIPNLRSLTQELHRILKIDGLLLFTALGPDSLKEFAMPAPWLDMHHIGDALLEAQFKAPIVDTEILTFTYESLEHLLQDLNQTGAYAIDTENLHLLPNIKEPCATTFEVIYGHAWGKTQIPQQFTTELGKVFVSADSIKCL
jgi:malonyl-CoA O-methyltransferase